MSCSTTSTSPLLEVNNSPSFCIDQALPVDAPEPITRAGRAQQRAEGCAVCRCMDLHTPHVHERCTVYELIKTQALNGALRIVAQALDGGSGEDEAYEPAAHVAADLAGTLVDVWIAAGAGPKCFSSASLRKTCAPLLQGRNPVLTTVDLDLAAQKCKKLAAIGHGKENPDLGLMAFELLLTQLASRARPEGGAEALAWLLAQL